MRYFFDTEFLDDGRTIDLISIGIVDEEGGTYYAVNADFNEDRATPWLRAHVLNHIPKDFDRKPGQQIAGEVSEFLRPGIKGYDDPVELWGWYCAYDWVALCQMYGPMIDRPKSFPKLAHDLKTLASLSGYGKISKEGFTKHNALEDAKWVRHAFGRAVDYATLHRMVFHSTLRGI